MSTKYCDYATQTQVAKVLIEQLGHLGISESAANTAAHRLLREFLITFEIDAAKPTVDLENDDWLWEIEAEMNGGTRRTIVSLVGKFKEANEAMARVALQYRPGTVRLRPIGPIS